MMEEKVIVNHDLSANKSKYRLVDQENKEMRQVNEFLDSLAVRGLSEHTTRIYAYDLLNLIKWIREESIDFKKIDKNKLLKYVDYQRQKTSPAATTINHRLTVAECFYQYCFDNRVPLRSSNIKEPTTLPAKTGLYRLGWLRPIGIKYKTRVKVPYHIIVPLTSQEVSRFFKTLKTWRDIAITGFMLFCGLRKREVLNIKTKDINVIEELVCIFGKGGRERIVPLAKDLIVVLNKYVNLERPQNSSECLFVVLKGQRRGMPMTESGIRRIFRYHRKISGIYKANPHRFRHTFGADMAKTGISLPVLMKLMGHAYIQTTMRYVNISAHDIRDEFHKVINKLQTREVIHEPRTDF